MRLPIPTQAIPNRRDVAEDKGIKIYFDAIETAARVEINKALVTRVFHEATAPLGERTLPLTLTQTLTLTLTLSLMPL